MEKHALALVLSEVKTKTPSPLVEAGFLLALVAGAPERQMPGCLKGAEHL